jgi:glutathione S-transferase
MAMKLYGTVTPNVQRVILTLFEAQVDVDKDVKLVLVSLSAKEQKQEAFLAKQPFGVVPCFEDGDLILIESRAISRYIAEKYQDQGVPLLGKTSEERAIINQWCEVEGQNFTAAALPMLREIFRAANEKRPVDEQIVAAGESKLGQVLDIYEAQLSKYKYIAGDDYTLADIFHAPMINSLLRLKKEVFTGRKHVIAWAEDLISRPAFQKTIETNQKWAKEEL